jgi:hypothetical protein
MPTWNCVLGRISLWVSISISTLATVTGVESPSPAFLTTQESTTEYGPVTHGAILGNFTYR